MPFAEISDGIGVTDATSEDLFEDHKQWSRDKDEESARRVKDILLLYISFRRRSEKKYFYHRALLPLTERLINLVRTSEVALLTKRTFWLLVTFI